MNNSEYRQQCFEERARLLVVVNSLGIELKMPAGAIDTPELRDFCLELELCPDDESALKAIKKSAGVVSAFLLLTRGIEHRADSNSVTSSSTTGNKTAPYSAIAAFALSAFDKVDNFREERKRGLE
jgi:hypothetical protein